MPTAAATSRGRAPSGDAATVGIIVNPHAGKDIRRLVSAAGQTSDAVKISIMRRVAAGAIEQGADRVLMSTDTHHLAERAVEGLDGPIEFLESPQTGSHHDTVAAARSLWKQNTRAVIALGGDGTCRDVATGWPDAPLIAISTGTNNVFPTSVDGTTAGVAAALVAAGSVKSSDVTSRAKRVSLQIDDPQRDTLVHEEALVEAALIDATFVGARAVSDPASIRWVVACIASPSSTGLAGIAGRVHPLRRDDPGGVLIRLGPGSRRVRVPLSPGSFSTLDIASVEPLRDGDTVVLTGRGVLAYDGERNTPVSAGATISVSVSRTGPHMIDVDEVLRLAALDRRFDVCAADHPSRKDTHGD
ncbi:NAD(+)/NADH kinase [Ilumatobacter nonamiensis]|uniref:NAD(+)/NADH kinase n=1 Tax=Ilumatobacter nonamiensis TaxID=467093 RepID=UPI000686B91F|nr:NAD(+)/NADH kinase [Ilumatobacter nonamiensis]